jgi:hypothetical protein
VRGAVVTFADITARKAAEAELRQAKDAAEADKLDIFTRCTYQNNRRGKCSTTDSEIRLAANGKRLTTYCPRLVLS